MKNKYDVFLSGNLVNLIILELKHAQKSEWYKWLNSKSLTKYTKQGYFPNTKEKQIKYFIDSIIKKKDFNKKIPDNQKLQ